MKRAEALLVIGSTCAPGVVVLREAELELVSIAGTRRVIALAGIESIAEGRWPPGRFVRHKRAFTLNTPISQPLAFAVAESIGARWSAVLGAAAGR